MSQVDAKSAIRNVNNCSIITSYNKMDIAKRLPVKNLFCWADLL